MENSTRYEAANHSSSRFFRAEAKRTKHSSFYPSPYDAPADMQCEISRNYRRLKTALDGIYGDGTAIISPVGETFLQMNNDRSLYASDLHHQGGRGYELMPMVMFSRIYGVFVGDFVAYESAASAGWTTQTEAEWREMLQAVKEILRQGLVVSIY